MVIFPTADSKEHHVNYIFVFWDITKYIRKHENDSILCYLNWGFVDHSLVGLGKPSRGGQATRVVLLVGVGSAETRTTLTVKEKILLLNNQCYGSRFAFLFRGSTDQKVLLMLLYCFSSKKCIFKRNFFFSEYIYTKFCSSKLIT